MLGIPLREAIVDRPSGAGCRTALAVARGAKGASVEIMVRLDAISTRTGDDGTTGLCDGSRLDKDHALIHAIGAVDEANCILGLVRLERLPPEIAAALPQVQNDLFDLGSDLATPPGTPLEARIPRIQAAQVERLDRALAGAVGVLAPAASFVLPAGSRAATILHVARTVVRRAERDVIAAGHALPQRHFNPELVRYLNRLSDLCFAWSRQCNDQGRADVLWVPGAGR
jgi:cob(I)alamin adenosyltransferase